MLLKFQIADLACKVDLNGWSLQAVDVVDRRRLCLKHLARPPVLLNSHDLEKVLYSESVSGSVVIHQNDPRHGRELAERHIALEALLVHLLRGGLGGDLL